MGWRSVSDCAAALRSREGATTVSVASSFSASTSARRPGAWMPSSLVIRIWGMNVRCGCVTPFESFVSVERRKGRWSGLLADIVLGFPRPLCHSGLYHPAGEDAIIWGQLAQAPLHVDVFD